MRNIHMMHIIMACAHEKYAEWVEHIRDWRRSRYLQNRDDAYLASQNLKCMYKIRGFVSAFNCISMCECVGEAVMLW